MRSKLFAEAVTKFLAGVVLVGLLIFLPAGTLHYSNGWMFMGLLFIPMFVAGLIMLAKKPELLRSRLDAKEKQRTQQIVVKLSGLMFVVGFVLAGLDHRFRWTVLPGWITWVGAALFLGSYLMYAEVLRENAYLSRTIQVQEGQTVITTGLYGIVRHPMYAATVLLFLSMPLILGSLISFLVFLFYPVLIMQRIGNEEQVLRKELHGYDAYCERTRYRLLPFIW